jgi:hypothetical protein
MFVFGKSKQSTQEEETEAERNQRIRIQKKSKFKEGLEKEFELEQCRQKVVRTSQLCKPIAELESLGQKIEDIDLEASHLEAMLDPYDRRQYGLKDYLNELMSLNFERDEKRKQLSDAFRDKRLVADEKEEPEEDIDRLLKGEAQMSELNYLVSQAERETEVNQKKLSDLNRDKIVLQSNIDRVKQLIRVADGLGNKGTSLNDPVHSEIERRVAHETEELNVQSKVSEIIIAELTAKKRKEATLRLNLAEETAEWQLEAEELERVLVEKAEEIEELDRLTDKLLLRVEVESKWKHEYQILKGVYMRIVDNHSSSARRASYRKKIERSMTETKKRSDDSYERQLSEDFDSKPTDDVFKEQTISPDQIALAVIDSYTNLKLRCRQLELEIESMSSNYKSKTDELYQLKCEKVELEKLYVQFLKHKKSVDISYITSYPQMVNQRSISPESSLMNISPDLIRLNPQPGSLQPSADPIPNGVVNCSSSAVAEQYSYIQPHVVERVVRRNVHIVDLYSRSKNIVCRLFDSLYLAKFIVQFKVEGGGSSKWLSAIDDILAKSEHFELDRESFANSLKGLDEEREAYLSSLLSGSQPKTPAEVPGCKFVRLKIEPPQIPIEELDRLVCKTFKVESKDQNLVSIISSSEIILANCSRQQLNQVFEHQKKLSIKEGNRRGMSAGCYVTHISDKVFMQLFVISLNNLLSKLFRVLRDYETLITCLSAELISNDYHDSLKDLRDRWERLDRKADPSLYEKYPKAREYDLGSQLAQLGPVIRPFQRVMDRLFIRDKKNTKEISMSMSRPTLSNSIREVAPTVDVDYVKNLVSVKRRNPSSLIAKSLETSHCKTEGGYVGKKQEMMQEVKRMVDYRGTLNNLKNRFDMSVREQKRRPVSIDNLTTADVKGKNYSMKIRNLIVRIKSNARSQANTSTPVRSKSLQEADKLEQTLISDFSTRYHSRQQTPQHPLIRSKRRVSTQSSSINHRFEPSLEPTALPSQTHPPHSIPSLYYPRGYPQPSIQPTKHHTGSRRTVQGVSWVDRDRMDRDIDAFILNPY